MFSIEIAFKSQKGSAVRKSVAVSGSYRDMGLFNLLYVISKSPFVVQFSVYSGNNSVMPEYFGFGEFEKWVKKIDYFGEDI